VAIRSSCARDRTASMVPGRQHGMARRHPGDVEQRDAEVLTKKYPAAAAEIRSFASYPT
jgi:hypothetical protein